MGKSFRSSREALEYSHKSVKGGRKARHQAPEAESTTLVALSEVFMSEAAVAKLLARDGQQIERYRQAYEHDEEMVRVVLRPRFDGGYNVEDGRHRVIAAKQAGVGFIEAKIID
ncbi:MAG TPA: hypothetical protein PKH78_01815 [Candidatus Obscuribacter sp.]|nr:hypothetical protein [Candidatus Obscuribacter sp.]HMY02215.1 hypothetical protein [Candidatus Obscuribacter sp.]HMY51579.1 hypothetical protein [Candidatus Obscuribacter sp.]HND05297.1 hypothetical protein [Candidatus Obscuribacter sp.]HND65537.1 hypothetical protein [Candidatus Obscuribacter sp.]